MSQRWLLCPFRLRTWTPSLLFISLIIAALLATISGDAQISKLKVDEDNVQLLLTKDPAEVRLPIQNLTVQKQKVLIYLEFVDTQAKVIAQADSSAEIEQTKTVSIAVPFSATKLKEPEQKQLLWMRLRYKLSADLTPTALAQGTLSFSQIAPELFEVRMATSYMAREGADYRVRVQAVNPITIKPVSGVRIAGDIVLENGDRDVHLEAFGNTNSLGYAILSFQIPKRFPLFPHEFQPDGGELHITAQRGALLTEFSGDVYVDQFPRILVTTYLIASYSLVTLLAGNTEEAERVNERLRSLVHSESNRSYWDLQTNTPFYGWGRAGRLETTALTLQALLSSLLPDKDQLINGALLFLLHNKDRYGVWYSTQATINVLEAMRLFLNQHRKISCRGDRLLKWSLTDVLSKSFKSSSDNQMFAPEIVDLSSAVNVGSNQIELRSSAGMKTASVQIVSNYYVPWRAGSQIETAHIKSGDAEAIKLETRFDKQEARVMDVITCHVKAERIGFRGYGMLLAEIGLPPGADVDRASLQAAMTGSGWSID